MEKRSRLSRILSCLCQASRVGRPSGGNAAELKEKPKTPLFRSTRGRTMQLTEKALSRVDAFRIVQRRAKAAGLLGHICNHSFRATGITVYLENGGALETAAHIAAHESPRTTKLYDRTADNITLEEIERIRF